jgi:hypothetical protein
MVRRLPGGLLYYQTGAFNGNRQRAKVDVQAQAADTQDFRRSRLVPSGAKKYVRKQIPLDQGDRLRVEILRAGSDTLLEEIFQAG